MFDQKDDSGKAMRIFRKKIHSFFQMENNKYNHEENR